MLFHKEYQLKNPTQTLLLEACMWKHIKNETLLLRTAAGTLPCPFTSFGSIKRANVTSTFKHVKEWNYPSAPWLSDADIPIIMSTT